MTRARLMAGASAVALLAGCASMDTAPVASPSTTLDRIKATKTITLGYRESSIPFSFVGPNKNPTGYSVELCARVAEAIRRDLQVPDLQVKWAPVTVDNRVAALLNNTIDLECGSTTNTLSRQEQVDFSLTTFLTGGSLLTLADANGADELRGVKIAVIPGTTTEQVLKDALGKAGPGVNAQLVPVKDHSDGLIAVQNKAVDAYASDRVILIGLAVAAKGTATFAILERYFSYEPYALMLRRGDPAFRLAVNRVLARLYRTGEISDIYNRWFAEWGVPPALLIAMYAIEGLPE